MFNDLWRNTDLDKSVKVRGQSEFVSNVCCILKINAVLAGTVQRLILLRFSPWISNGRVASLNEILLWDTFAFIQIPKRNMSWSIFKMKGRIQ